MPRLRRTLLLGLLVLLPLTTGRSPQTRAETDPAAAAPFVLELKTEPRRPLAGGPVKLTFTVRHRESGRPVTQFDNLRERPFSLFIVRDDLGLFFHELPEFHEDGTFTGTFIFPTGGNWRFFGEITPKGAASQRMMAALDVDGPRGQRVPLMPDLRPVVTQSGMTLTMRPTNLIARRTLPVTFTLTDTTGRPLPDLQPWRDAMAHLIFIEHDAATFVHSRLEEIAPQNRRTGSLTFPVHFPKPGVYKGWMQLQRNNVVYTMPFVVRALGEKVGWS